MRINRLFSSIQGILILALILRLLAAIFSWGYAFHDDHFDVLRVAEAWTEGIQHWVLAEKPPKHSFFYAAVVAGFLALVKITGISDPMAKAVILQCFHGLYSLLTVYLGYRIADTISSRRNALNVGLILAVLWFMPYLGVKFMAEVVSVPPLLYAFYLFIKNEQKNWTTWLLIGAMIGLSFSIRMHTILLAGGIGLALLVQKEFKGILLISVSFILTILVLIGIPDVVFFNYPLESIVNYFAYNSKSSTVLVSGGPFKYVATVLGFLIPPVSLMLVWGFGRSFKVNPAIFLGVLVFFVAHSAFPHKQERFILPMFPFLIILGTIGWENFVLNSSFWGNRQRLLNGFWKFFWIINIVAGLFMALNYTKKDRIAPLYLLSDQQDLQAVLLEGTQGGTHQPPAYYLGEHSLDYVQFGYDFMGLQEYWKAPESIPESTRLIYSIDRIKSFDSLRQEFIRMDRSPNYVAFYRQDSIEERKADITSFMNASELVHMATIEPSMLDKLLNFFNPRIHKRNTVEVYRIEKAP